VNSGAASRWLSQTLHDVRVTVAGSTAVLVATVTDEIRTPEGPEVFRMPVTQTWVREDGRWLCLAGHAGPRL
jgi:ketosteroid isomerase-like protein